MPQSYTINPGDTLSGIAQKFGYGTDYNSIAQANGIANPNVIRAGATINIPDRAPTAAPTSTQPPAPAAAPQASAAPTAAPSSSGGFGTWLQSHGYTDPNVIAQAEANPASMGSAYQDYQRESGAGSGMGGAPTIDLQGIYDKAFQDAGITNLQSSADSFQSQIDSKKQALSDATGKINDNPYYSEATRGGRIAKLNDTANADINNLISQQTNAQNKVSAAKADAQVKVNLATQQYNIDDQRYQQNVTMFNNLLTSGALDNASGADIAQIATSTGMSTSMISSIIASGKAKENKPQLVTVDDGTNQKLVGIDPSGNIVSTTILGPTTAKSSSGGSSSDSSVSTAPGGKESGISTGQYNKVAQILGQADIMDQSNDKKKADKKLAPWEAQAAINQTAAFLGTDAASAADVVARVMESEGYGTWTP